MKELCSQLYWMSMWTTRLADKVRLTFSHLLRIRIFKGSVSWYKALDITILKTPAIYWSWLTAALWCALSTIISCTTFFFVIALFRLCWNWTCKFTRGRQHRKSPSYYVRRIEDYWTDRCYVTTTALDKLRESVLPSSSGASRKKDILSRFIIVKSIRA